MKDLKLPKLISFSTTSGRLNALDLSSTAFKLNFSSGRLVPLRAQKVDSYARAGLSCTYVVWHNAVDAFTLQLTVNPLPDTSKCQSHSRCVATLGTAGGLLALGAENPDFTSRSPSCFWKLGFGTVTSQSLIDWSLPGIGGLLIAVLVASSFQVLLYSLYLMYNGVFTCMLLADEWAGYARRKQCLRVISRRGY